MGKIKKIVNGVVVEVDEPQMVKTIENGVVVERPFSEVKKKVPFDVGWKASTSGLNLSKLGSALGGKAGGLETPSIKNNQQAVGLNAEQTASAAKRMQDKWNEMYGQSGVVDTNDPIKSMLNPIRTGLMQQRQMPVSSSTSTTVSRAAKSAAVTDLKQKEAQIKGLRFDNMDQAGGFLSDKLDKTKLVRKSEIDITKQPSLEDFTEESIIAATPKDNETAQIAAKQFVNTKKIKDAVSTSASLEEAALKSNVKRGGLVGKQIEELQGNIPNSMKGALMSEFLQSPELKELADNDPELTSKIQEEVFEFPDRYPSAAVRFLAQIISDERGKRGENNAILNITSAKTSDKIVEDLVASGKLPMQYKYFYENPDNRFIINRSLKTPGLLENTAESLGQSFLGIGKSLSELTGIRNTYTDNEDRLYGELEKQYSGVQVKPRGLMQSISTHGGVVLGQVAPMALGGNLLKVGGIIRNEKIGNAVMAGLQSFGENRDRAEADLPGQSDAVKLGYATINTGIEAALASVFNDTKYARELLGKYRPSIQDVITKFTSKEISEAAAKKEISGLFNKMVDFGKKTVKVAVPEANEEAATDLLQKASNQVFGGEPITLSQAAEDAFEVWRTTFLGSLVLGGAAAFSKSKSNNQVKDMIFEMAEEPERYLEIIQGQASIDEDYATDAEQKVDNLAYIAKRKKELDSQAIPEAEQKNILVNELDARMKEQPKIEPQLNAVEQTFVEAIEDKEFNILKPYTDILQNPESTVQEKKDALRGISDQMLAPSTAERVGEELGGKLSTIIDDLGYEAPVESDALKAAIAGEQQPNADLTEGEPEQISQPIELDPNLPEGYQQTTPSEEIQPTVSESKDVLGDVEIGGGIKNDTKDSDFVLSINEVDKLRKQKPTDLATGNVIELDSKINKYGLKESAVITYYPNEGVAELTDGHTRLDILKDNGAKNIPIRIVEKYTTAPQSAKAWNPPAKSQSLLSKEQPTEQKQQFEQKPVNLPTNAKEASNIGSEENKGTSDSPQPSGKESPEKLKQRYERVISETDFTDPYDIVLNHFASGGKINSNAISELFGGKDPRINLRTSTENERRPKISILGKDASSIDDLAHSLWESDPTGKYDTQDYKNAIESVLLDYNSKSSMQEAIVDKYDLEAAYEKYAEQRMGKEAIDIVESLSEEEMNAILELDADKERAEELSQYLDSINPNVAKQTEVDKLTKERDEKIMKEGKPDVKMEFVPAKDLVDSKDPIGNKKIHDDLKERYKKVKSLLDCLWQKK